MTEHGATHASDPNSKSAQVRSQAVWAAIAAGMMLWFGFKYPYVNDSFVADLLNYTLQYGGIAMALSAVLLLSGWPPALMLDGVFAMIIGAALAAAGVIILVTHSIDLQSILFVVFGYLFFTSGLRNFKDYCRLGAVDEEADEFAPPS